MGGDAFECVAFLDRIDAALVIGLLFGFLFGIFLLGFFFLLGLLAIAFRTSRGNHQFLSGRHKIGDLESVWPS